MFSTDDTIVAIATPPGRGGIGVVRLSGSAAPAIAQQLVTYARPLEPRHATLTLVRPTAAPFGRTASLGGDAIDQVVVIHFPAPASYTGEDVVEVSAHGSPLVLRTIVEAARPMGFRER